jgi:flagellar motor switch protein FliG
MTDKPELLGTERAAAFLLSLERDNALSLLRHLNEDLVSDVASAMTELGDKFSDSKEVDELYYAIARQLITPQAVSPQSKKELRTFLEEAFGPDGADSVLDDIRQRQLTEKPFRDVEAFPPKSLAKAFADETSTSCAIVLSHVDPSFSAEVLGNMEPEIALETVTKMATLLPPGTNALKSMARNLTARLRIISRQPVPPDPSLRLKTIAEMLNYSNQELESSVMEGIEAEDSDMAGEIREYMFTWAELSTIDKRAMQKILGSVDTRTLSIALKACAADVEENISSNLSTRVKAMVIEERELAGAVPMSEVMQSRGEIMKAVHSLIESGDLSPARSGEELVE